MSGDVIKLTRRYCHKADSNSACGHYVASCVKQNTAQQNIAESERIFTLKPKDNPALVYSTYEKCLKVSRSTAELFGPPEGTEAPQTGPTCSFRLGSRIYSGRESQCKEIERLDNQLKGVRATPNFGASIFFNCMARERSSERSLPGISHRARRGNFRPPSFPQPNSHAKCMEEQTHYRALHIYGLEERKNEMILKLPSRPARLGF